MHYKDTLTKSGRKQQTLEISYN